MSDIEIARAAKKKPIFEIGDVLGTPPAETICISENGESCGLF